MRELIGREFGPGIFSASGDLNRAAIRSIVFADAEKKRALEQILHPRIRRQWSLEAESHRNSTDLFFADIPLLYETGGETLCDSVVVVACSPSLQLERLIARTQLDRAAAATNDQCPNAARRKKFAGPITWFGIMADARCSPLKPGCS